MKAFTYRALTKNGDRCAGEIQAPDQQTAVRLLRTQGLLPIEAVAESGRISKSGLLDLTAVSSRATPELTIFVRELATLIRAGEPLERAMALIIDDTGDKALSNSLRRVRFAVRGGQSFTDALAAEPAHYPRLMIAMIRAGEATGRLHQVLDEIAIRQERQAEARKKLVSVLTYPVVLVLAAVTAVSFMLLVVVPQFAAMLEGQEASLPGTTRFVLDSSAWLAVNGWALLIVLLSLLAAGIFLPRITAIRHALDTAILKAGLLGSLPKEHVTAQLARGLGTLIKGGLDLPAALTMATEMVSNTAARNALARTRTAIRQGQRLANALQRENIIAPMGLRLLRTGEESGRLGELSLYLADQMERRIEQRTQRLLSLAQPVLVITLGIVVGGITVSIINAMLDVNSNVL